MYHSTHRDILDGIHGNRWILMGMDGKGLEQREGRDFEELELHVWFAYALLKIMS